MKKSLLTEALTIAKRKLHQHPEGKRYLHYTFVIQNRRMVEWGMNGIGMPHKHYGYHSRILDPGFRPKTHSELSGWRKARGLLDKRKSFEIINVRLNASGMLRLAKPCIVCYNLMKSLGCDKFYFTTNEGFEKEV